MVEILIVEDEKAISDLIRINLSMAGYSCTTAYDGKEAADLLENRNFDLVLLDVMLPEISGFELMEYIRPMSIPVIFITAMGSLDNRVKGLTSGAEDYIVKPFEIAELMARVNIVLKKKKKTEKTLEFRDIVIDIDNQMVTKNGEQIELTPKEFELITLLVRNVGITLVRDKIYEEIWGMEYSVETRTLDLHIQRLRKKLDLNTSLKTVFKVGYRLE